VNLVHFVRNIRFMSSPETQSAKPEEVTERPEDFVVPERISDIATPTQSQVSAQVADDQGRNLIQTPQPQGVVVRIPSDQSSLQAMSKGDPDNASTGFGIYWLRVIKKAVLFGWSVVMGKKEVVG
jgi:hypothetical protein